MRNGNRGRFGFVLVSALAASSATACGVLFPLDDYATLGPADASADASSSADATDGAACGARPPPRVPSTAADVAGDVVYAIDSLDFVDPATSPKGYDLDETCTTSEATRACRVPGERETILDVGAGVDNGGFPIFALGSLRPRTLVADGAYGVVVVVRKWNRTADDPAVEVAVYNSPGAKSPLKKDGTDTLPIVNEGPTGASPVPAYRADDSKAYVAGGVLVAHLEPEAFDSGPALDDFNFGYSALSFDRLRVPFSTAVLTAKLEGQGASARLVDGVLAGLIYPDELLTSLPLLSEPSTGDAGPAYVCADTAKHREASDKICARVDATQAIDPAEVCDYTSAVMAFTATSARLGPVVAPSYVSGCPRPLPIEACQ